MIVSVVYHRQSESRTPKEGYVKDQRRASQRERVEGVVLRWCKGAVEEIDFSRKVAETVVVVEASVQVWHVLVHRQRGTSGREVGDLGRGEIKVDWVRGPEFAVGGRQLGRHAEVLLRHARAGEVGLWREGDDVL